MSCTDTQRCVSAAFFIYSVSYCFIYIGNDATIEVKSQPKRLYIAKSWLSFTVRDDNETIISQKEISFSSASSLSEQVAIENLKPQPDRLLQKADFYA